MTFLKGSADPVIFDIGANHGEWTRGIWRALGTGRYYAYEPQSACQASLASLQIPSLTIIQSGMSDQPGEIDLHSTPQAVAWRRSMSGQKPISHAPRR